MLLSAAVRKNIQDVPDENFFFYIWGIYLRELNSKLKSFQTPSIHWEEQKLVSYIMPPKTKKSLSDIDFAGVFLSKTIN